MRYYDLNDLLNTWAQEFPQDRETLRLQTVDLSAAIIALREAGGAPTSSNLARDTADGLYRLMVNMTVLAPFRGALNDRAAAASARQYARNRGFELRLNDGGLELAQVVEADGLDPADICRAYMQALRPTGEPPRCPDDLAGATVSISHAVSDPSPQLKGLVSVMRTGIAAVTRQLGGQVRLPSQIAAHNVASARKSFTASVQRVLDAGILVVIGDPKGQGCAVEREWALRLGIHIIEFVTGPAIHPHRDGPERVTTIPVDPRRPEQATQALREKLREFAWAAQDQTAAARSYEVKNSEELAHLRGVWAGLSNRRQRALAGRVHMSGPYIEGLLHSGLGLELASEEQRRALELMLHLPAHRRVVAPRRLTSRDEDLIADETERLRLSHRDTFRVAAHVEHQLAKSRLRGQMNDSADARKRVEAALRSLGIAFE